MSGLPGRRQSPVHPEIPARTSARRNLISVLLFPRLRIRRIRSDCAAETFSNPPSGSVDRSFASITGLPFINRNPRVSTTVAIPCIIHLFHLGQSCMGIDLKLLASNLRERRGELLSTATLRLDRDARLLSLLSKDADPCLVQPLPAGLKVGHYEDDGLRFDDKDRYGNPLTFTTPEQVGAIRTLDELSDWNRAVLAFLFALPPDARIVLYWC